ncbi:MAG TPA: NAD(P)-dependent oxidoreductase [bacterium]
MNVLITGGTGFLGSRLASAWKSRGHRVAVTSSGTGVPPPGALRFRLGEPFDGRALEGIVCVVHGAHAFGGGTHVLNVEGTRALFIAARAAGVRHQVFISSASAQAAGASAYGRVKRAVEPLFLDAGETVVRPGLVLGRGGMFGRVMDRVLSSPVIPLLAGGEDLVPVVAEADFVAAMTEVLEGGLRGSWNLVSGEQVTMRRLLGTLARLAGRRRLFVPVPTAAAERLLSGMERLGIPFPVGADSVRSIAGARRAPPPASDLPRLIGAATPLEEALAAALGPRPPR